LINCQRQKDLLADRGYDAEWFRATLIEKGITPCIPPKKNRKVQYEYDKTLYRQRHKIENMFGWLKDWRRIVMRHDRCAHTFFAAICIAARFPSKFPFKKAAWPKVRIALLFGAVGALGEP
jgi:putative transposase